MQTMPIRTKKTLFLSLIGCIVLSLVYFLFENDIKVLLNQWGVLAIRIPETQVTIFAQDDVTQGYVEYISEENAEQVMLYPDLPSVNAMLTISRVGIHGPIVEGKDERAMNMGFWHFSSASPYALKGNVVLIGHRYLKLPPHQDTFYNLDKVRQGDIITIKTDDRKFVYKARQPMIIAVTETSVLQQTENSQLTLITCHPLWTSKQRLVIIADKVEE